MKRFYIILSCFLFLALVSFAEYDYNTYFLQSVCEREIGNTSARYRYLEHALQLNPKSAEALSEMAQLMYNYHLEEPEKIIKMVQLAHDIEPQNVDYTIQLVDYLMADEDVKHAVPLLEKLKENKRGRDKAYEYLTMIYEKDSDNVRYINTIDEWLKHGGDEEMLLTKKIVSYKQHHKFDEALQIADSLVNNFYGERYYTILKAGIYLDMNDTLSAKRLYDKVVDEEPDNVSAQLFLISYYSQLGNKDMLLNAAQRTLLNNEQPMQVRASLAQSIIGQLKGTSEEYRIKEIFNKILEQPLEDATLLTMYLKYLSQVKALPEEIISVQARLIEINPSDITARMCAMQNEFDKKNYQKVIELANDGLAFNPHKAWFYILAANAYVLNKNNAKAIDIFQKGAEMIRIEEENSDVLSTFYTCYADIMYKSDSIRKAFELYDMALTYNPSSYNTLNNYAYFLSETDTLLEKARTMSEQSIKYAPDESIYYDTYAWIMFKLKNYEEALKYALMAIDKMNEADEKNAVLYEHLGDIYYHIGSISKALEYWEKAYSTDDEERTHQEYELLGKKIKTKKYIEE